MNQNRANAAAAFKRMNDTRRAWTRWMNAVDAYLAGEAPYPNPGRRPTEARTMAMYGAAGQLMRAMGWDGQRPHDTAGIDALIVRAKAELVA